MFMDYEDTPITKWFKIKNKDYIMSPKYFYYNDNNQILFLTERPKKYYRIGSIKWKQYDTILNICCSKKRFNNAHKKSSEINRFRNITSNNYNIKQIPILKSNLQKCIRRSLSDQSRSTALTILCLKSSELLRRLPIIMLEDVILNNDFLFLIWLMCANSKGYPINDNCMLKIINIVNQLALCNSRDLYYKNEDIDIRKLDLSKILEYQKNILWAIQLRKSYGGMKGDMKMLNYFTKKWYDRFKNEYDLIPIINNIQIDQLRLIRFDDIHISSIDFHCTNIINFITNKYPNYENEEIKKAIWYNRSCYNNKNINEGKEEINNEYKEIWYKINKYVDFSSKIILLKLGLHGTPMKNIFL